MTQVDIYQVKLIFMHFSIVLPSLTFLISFASLFFQECVMSGRIRMIP